MDVNAQLVDVFFKVARLMKGEMAYSSKLMSLTMVQLQALIFIKRNPHTQMSEVANFFQIELPSATSLINTLVKLGLVQRKSDEKDRRLVRISPTQKGLRLLADAMKVRSEKTKQTLSHLSAEDKKSLLEILERLTIKLETIHEK